MLKAWRDGEKTETRRVVVPQPAADSDFVSLMTDSKGVCKALFHDPKGGFHLSPCRYGPPGADLYICEPLHRTDAGFVAYDDGKFVLNEPVEWKWKVKKLSSRYMPRWAARQFTTNKNVTVERVQDISAQSALNEGICTLYHGGIPPFPPDAFRDLWNSINMLRGYGWDSNPYVFVIETPLGSWPR